MGITLCTLVRIVENILTKQIPPPSEEKYRGSLSPEIREHVLLRDNYQCQLCGTENQVAPHHITFRSQGGQDIPANLITLCFNCHRWLHDHPKSVLVKWMHLNGEQIPILYKQGRIR